MSNLRTSFIKVGILVRKVYVPQLAHMCVTIIAQTGSDVNILRHGVSVDCKD